MLSHPASSSVASLSTHPAQWELIGRGQDIGAVHNGHAGRIFKWNGRLFARGANGVYAERLDDGSWRHSREPFGYVSFLDPQGRLCGFDSSYDYSRWHTLRRAPVAGVIEGFQVVRDDLAPGYSGGGIDTRGNMLLVAGAQSERWWSCETYQPATHYAANTGRTPVHWHFYDAPTDQWTDGIIWKDSLFSYHMVLVQGRRAFMVDIEDHMAGEPTPTNWHNARFTRLHLHATEDATEGFWDLYPVRENENGWVIPQGLGMDSRGRLFILYAHDERRWMDTPPNRLELALFDPGSRSFSFVDLGPGGHGQVFLDERGRYHLLSFESAYFCRNVHTPMVYRVSPGPDPADWSSPVVIEGSDRLGEHIFTLDPNRFGGEGNDDTVHLWVIKPTFPFAPDDYPYNDLPGINDAEVYHVAFPAL
ncbi:MAG: hypothetical protein HYU36_04165 [Planctomycetes bacterium]|nr:hypothetical protein [Planctomycetota bacterium]